MTFTKKTANRIVAVVLSCVVFIATLFMPSASVSAYTPKNEELSYSMYSKSGDYTGSYTLSALDTVSSNLSTAGIIGTDDRYQDPSKCGVVMITTDIGIYAGFVVSEHVIATTAQNFSWYTENYDDDLSHIPVSISLHDSSGTNTLTLGKSDVVSIHIPENFFAESLHAGYDYALIVVKEDLSDYMCFNLGTMLDSYVGGEVYITGYTAYTGKGTVLQIDECTFNYDVDTTETEVGAPIYVVTSFQGKEYYTVVGINTYGVGTADTSLYNFGTSITPSLLHFYLNNPYITV